jgi:hypothetical protein
MSRYLIVSLVSGLLFAFLDGLVNANPLARDLYQVFKPIAKTSINVTAGILIDLVYGFVMAGLFLTLYNCLPGRSGLVKGVTFAAMTWFFRVLMQAVGEWITLEIPVKVLVYTMVAGAFEMLTLGILYGLTLKERA